ncbi:Pit accessory protein [Mesorhizobium japonicum MAFF 303099]|uniref:Pit accessory protein n=1 Tax=Mesorhizobium japonicum (strain LMG 29417 / CECT 9101 / MAFF 303099) TaxID=266835 RepID=Q983E0_RHILO|nr:Pit accessory protein [Mesorhizobium japonicum MAFF 303099]
MPGHKAHRCPRRGPSRARSGKSCCVSSRVVRIHIFQPAYCFQWLAGALCEWIGSWKRDGRLDMLGWFRKLLPREDRFFDLFERHSRTVVGGAEALEQLLQGKDIDRCVRRSSISRTRPIISPPKSY